MAEIEILAETEQANRWSYRVRVFQEGKAHQYDMTLSWADYDLWCHGRLAPQEVVKAVVAFLLDHEPATAIMSQFDCSIVRRYFPKVDQELASYFGKT